MLMPLSPDTMKRLVIPLLMSVLLGTAFLSCVMVNTETPVMHRLQPHIKHIVRTLSPLDLTQSTPPDESLQAYYAYYRLNFEGVERFIGTFQSGEYVLAGQVFRPARPEGTVFLLHGYIDHTGMLRPLIRHCLEQGYAVAVYDLPGHGLSNGDRISIEHFGEYVAAFQHFLHHCRPHLPRPYHLISHSTGSAIFLEYLLHNEEQHPFERVVFLAPLVRHVHWHLSKITYTLGKVFRVKYVPRRYSEISSDRDFLKFLRRDPLQPKRVPVNWIGALYDWEEELHSAESLHQPLLIIQGSRDTVVEAEYNIPFLQQKIQGATAKWIEGAGHQLINEIPPIQQEVFHAIDDYLKS